MKPGETLRALTRTPLILVAVLITLGYAAYITHKLYQNLVVAPWQERVTERVTAEALSGAGYVSRYFSRLQNQLQAAGRDAELARRLAPGGNDEDAGEDAAVIDRLKQEWPNISEISVLKSYQAYPDRSNNFVATDLLRQAGNGDYPEPAAGKLEDDWHIFVASPVLDGSGSVAGIILVRLAPEALDAALQAVLSQATRVELQQTTRGFAPQTIYQYGASSAEGPSATAPVKTIVGWNYFLVGPSTLTTETPKPVGYFAISVAGIICAVAAIIYLLAHYQTLLSRNITSVLKKEPSDDNDISPEQLEEMVAESLAERKAEGAAKRAQLDSDVFDISTGIPRNVFRNYDIRGEADREISVDFANLLGKTLATRALRASQSALAVAADGRVSSPRLKKALVEGILSTGCNVIDFGQVPTPIFNFGIYHLNTVDSGVIVTASHNPMRDNGFKLVMDNRAPDAEAIQTLADGMSGGDWDKGKGTVEEVDVVEPYFDAVSADVVIATPLKIVVDGASGAMGPFAPGLLEAFGCEVIPLYCEVDGTFPYHPPDPSDPNNLKDLITTVTHQQADLGFAFDGDGDRVVAVSGSGRIVWPDELMMVFARDLLTKQPGADVVFDVKSTRRLNALVSSYGGRPLMWKTGHSNIRNKIAEAEAPLGGEFSGHIFFRDRWFGVDDGLYTAARLIEILSLREQSLDEMIEGFDVAVATPEIKVPVDEEQKFELIEKLRASGDFGDGIVNDIDGIRVEYSDGWGLVRASNTSANLTLRFEAENEAALGRIQAIFKPVLEQHLADVKLPF